MDLVINEEEAVWVRELFYKVVHEGASGYALAEILNNRGLRTRAGAKFQSSNILRIIRHEGYAAKAEVVHLVLGLQDPLAVIGLAAVRQGHVIGFVNISAHQLAAVSTNTLSTLPSLPFGKVNTSLSSRSWYR